MPFYTISFTNLRYVPKEWMRIYLMRRQGTNLPVTPKEELTKGLKSGKMLRQTFLSYYEQQIDTYPVYQYLRDLAEESRERTILLIDYEATPDRGQRGVLAKKIKSLFPWVDMKGEWKK